jgi:DNA polymerase I-like protein with 3'-5' exonuclease and polymerase domains
MSVGRLFLLVNCDIKSLELVVVAQLANDAVMRQEIIEKQDLHENNRAAFSLPSRLIAKVFNFRLVYGGSAYSYAHDSDFMGVSTSERFWQDVIDKYYAKYSGIAKWHAEIEYVAKNTGRLVIPSGRYYPFEYEQTKYGVKWPSTKVKNYPVQGFGADLVMLARLEFFRRFRESGIPGALVSTIHDSIVVDCPAEYVPLVAKLLKESIEAVPALCKKLWNYDFSLPLTCEVSAGLNKKDMKELTFA